MHWVLGDRGSEMNIFIRQMEESIFFKLAIFQQI